MTVTDNGQVPMTVTFSTHARKRMNEMLVDDDEVIDAVHHPDITQPADDGVDGRVAVKGRLRVVYATEKDQAKVITVVWQDTQSYRQRSAGPVTVVPNKVSNRALLDKLELWGATIGRRKGDFVRVHTRSGQTLQLRPATLHVGNPAKVIDAAVAASGAASREEFWARTEPVAAASATRRVPAPVPPPAPVHPTPTEPVVSRPTTPVPALASHAGRVLAWYRAHPGQAVHRDTVAPKLGLDQTAMTNASTALERGGHLQRVDTGVYKYLRWGETDADREQAQRDLVWVTDPANPPSRQKNRKSPATGQIIDFCRRRPGQTIATATVVTATGLRAHTVHTVMSRLADAGTLERLTRGKYRWADSDDTPVEPEVVDTEPVPEPEPEPDPVPEPEPDPVPEPEPVAEQWVATWTEPATVVHADIDDEIEATLDLLIPEGIRARHFAVAAQWYDATRTLLEAVRRDQPRRLP